MSTKWISDSEWTCARHIPMTRFPVNLEQCWYCRAERPPLDGRNPVIPSRASAPKPQPRIKTAAVAVVGKCAWGPCKNASASNSKYCSRTCSNRNARARFSKSQETLSELAFPRPRPQRDTPRRATT